MKNLTLIDRLPESFDETAHEQIARGGLWTAYSLQRAGGMKTIDSVYEPRGEARRTLLRAEAWPGRPTLVLGSGSGYFARVIAEEDLAPALLITGSRVLLRCNEKRLRKQLPDNEAWLTLVADDDPERIWGEDIAPFLAAHPDTAVVSHPREVRAFPGLFNALETKLLRHRSGQSTAVLPARRVRRVLWVGSGALFEREVLTDLRDRGIDVERIGEDTLRGLTSAKALQLLDLTRPDLLLSTNNRGSDERGVLAEACRQLGVHWATWFLDEPRYLFHPDEREGTRTSRWGFAWDENGIDGWRELGFERSAVLPLATDDRLFTPGAGRDDLAGRVVFVGSARFVRADGFFGALDPSPVARKAARALEREIIDTRRPPTGARVEELLATLDPDRSLDPEARRRLPAYAVQEANRSYRAGMLNRLAEYRPVVFGSGWEGLLDDRIELRSPVDFYTELPDIYRSDAIHLSFTNLQMRSHPNQRPFDMGAAGRAVLMDRVSALPELFGSELADALTVSDGDDLAARVEQWMLHPDRRRELGDDLRRVVRERHTVHHRIDTLLDTLHENM